VLRGVAAAPVLLVVAGACSDDGTDPAAVLADRVAAVLHDEQATVADRLGQLGVTSDGDLAEALAGDRLQCPAVDDPAPGDRATCTAEIDAVEVAIEIEFRAGDRIGIVNLGVEQ
jgi:hypothetical protein